MVRANLLLNYKRADQLVSATTRLPFGPEPTAEGRFGSHTGFPRVTRYGRRSGTLIIRP
jgi:hypothetical protein